MPDAKKIWYQRRIPNYSKIRYNAKLSKSINQSVL